MINSIKLILLISSLVSAVGCIQDDLIDDEVDPVLRIVNPIDSIGINESFQFEQMYLNNVGLPEEIAVNWESSNPAVVSIDASGLALARDVGSAEITVSTVEGGAQLRDMLTVHVGQATVMSNDVINGQIVTTSSYLLEGDFEMMSVEGNLQITIAENYRASTALPGLYIYLGNNKNSIAGALEIGKVEVFSGAHSYTIEGVGVSDYGYILYWCKPFNIKVGEGEISN